jgi:hypothetical protein
VKYTVVWAAKAQEELAEIWLNVTDRAAVARAADSLDYELSQNPAAVGESRPSGRRIAYCLPLGIQFRISEDDRLVRVLAVWVCGHPDKADRQ